MTWTCCPNTTDTTEGWVPCDPCADGEHASCCTHPAAVDGVGPDTVIVGCCCAGHEQGID